MVASKQTQQALHKAFASLLGALGVPKSGCFARTPQRAADLWRGCILAGEGRDRRALLRGAMPYRGKAPTLVQHLGLHMVCPHHLTIAFGTAAVAYLPHGRLLGFGTLSDLVQACTARFVLQEDATQDICDALVKYAGARAAMARIVATHPCHNLTHPRAHAARATTVAQAGTARGCRALYDLWTMQSSRRRR